MTKRAGPRYAIIPADAVTDNRLVGADLKVLALLGRHIDKKGWCARTQGRMADELEITRVTIQRALTRLVDAGYVEISAVKRNDGGQGANRYRVILDDDARADQLDLFSSSADAVRPARSAGREAEIIRDAPPCITHDAPLHHLDDAPPASPGRCTHKNDPFQNVPSITSPSAEAAPNASQRVAANDTSPVDPRKLAERLRQAAGEAINTAHPTFIPMTEPMGWIWQGCDLDADILPTIAGLCARHVGSPIRSWKYFAPAVVEARDRRLALARPDPAGADRTIAPDATIVPFDPRGARYEQHRQDQQPSHGRFAAAAARRRREFAGLETGGAPDEN